jgi:hypothetical protein
VLPTDRKYKRLTDKQKELLFMGWLELPTSDELRQYHMHIQTTNTPVITEDDAASFQRLGYTREQIAKMKDQLKKAGFAQPM